MTSHHPTLETCQRLKAAGFPQKTLFYWVMAEGKPESAYLWYGKTVITNLETAVEYCAAPIATEVAKQFTPGHVDIESTVAGWRVWWENKVMVWDENLAEAAAQLWLKRGVKEGDGTN